ncbi:glycyl-radical enzyme activating protein [Sunxiuqinia indica]|uniref:glycyl-radical enzyme activating protein n=1 Tax=Sunxiuqinia indica TaxID=2692584 RepID=UPI001359B73E|nr:glycyl-radical enzyme activating protein [Sunxiuqinia indica]
MDGMIFDIKRFAIHDGPGIRTTIFLKGCPLKCQWCHNPESIDKNPICIEKTVQLNGHKFTEKETIGYQISSEELMDELLKEQVFMQESGGGVTFSGGEPLLQYDFLAEMLQTCQASGIHTTLDTSLFANWSVIEKIAGHTNLFLVDLKIMDDQQHQLYTGVSNKTILENIQRLTRNGSLITIRIPMIPGVSTTPENVNESIEFLKTLKHPFGRIDLLPFHNTAKEKYKRFHMENHFIKEHSLKKEELATIKKQFENAGFTVQLGG